ncbi:unnamed protein product [Cuscuta campestris]|uniref:Uncharacterized protein n=1 Tax=Cuscuta campestris TaxID=132261 RepID=A0A484LM34_9ASTE|nr:unnamed protein product [Cuscuta campestris]
MEDERAIGDSSPIITITRSKQKAKRGTVGLEERSELYHKTVKVRDLEHPGEINGKDNGEEIECSSQSDRDRLFKMYRRDVSVSHVNMGVDNDLGLNADDVSSSVNANSFHHHQYHQNSIGQAAVRPRGNNNNVQKRKNERMKKKIELAMREQADRFAKIAAPTGLLTGLNPGIINHVRNTKQVHSIIEALVKSEKYDNNSSVEGKRMKIGERKDIEKATTLSALSAGRHIIGYSSVTPSNGRELEGRNGNLCTIGKRTIYPSNYNNTDCCNNTNVIITSNVGPTNLNDVTALSINAAKIAAQWLELLNQDTRCRLAALRSSRKRVRDTIQIDFRCLISREFSCNDNNNNDNPQQDSRGCEKAATVNAHHARWSALFYQLDESLSEEESQLVSWHKQVQEMQMRCERGLIKYSKAPCGSPQLVALHNDPERDLAVRAAAASIYSTCNFLSSMENQNQV